MPRADHVSSIADHHAIRTVLASCGKTIQFFQDRMRVYDDSRRNHRLNVALKNAGWQKTEFICVAVEFNRVPGVVSALVADNDVVFFREQVDDFAFGFVAPLHTNNRCCRHRFFLAMCGKESPVAAVLDTKRNRTSGSPTSGE